MFKSKTLSRIGGVLALFSLLALPLGSCGAVRLNGAEILFKVQDHPVLKLLVLISIIVALLAIFFTSRGWQLTLGAAGVLSLLVASFLVEADKNAATQVRGGTVLALIGFILVLVPGLLKPDEANVKRRST